MKKVKRINITPELFTNRKIRQLESLPGGDSLIVVWLKLLCLAGNVNDRGAIYLTKDTPYTEQKLSMHFNRPLSVIQMALSLFQQYEMIKIVDDIIYISAWEKYQNAV